MGWSRRVALPPSPSWGASPTPETWALPPPGSPIPPHRGIAILHVWVRRGGAADFSNRPCPNPGPGPCPNHWDCVDPTQGLRGHHTGACGATTQGLWGHHTGLWGHRTGLWGHHTGACGATTQGPVGPPHRPVGPPHRPGPVSVNIRTGIQKYMCLTFFDSKAILF